MGNYRTFGTALDRIFRNDLNNNFNDIATDINAQKKRVDDLIVGTPQPSEVVDARGGKTVLKDRLDAVDASLADIATNVNSFGAKGDWNGTTGTDDSVAIQSAIDYLVANGGGKLIFPNNGQRYLIKKPIIVNGSNVVIDGNGSQLFCNGMAQGTSPYLSYFFVGNTTGNVVSNIEIKNFVFNGAYGYSIRAKYASNIRILNNTCLNGLYESFYFGKCSHIIVEGNYIDGSVNNHGITFDGLENSSDATCSHWIVKDNTIKNCKWMAIDGHSSIGTYGKVIDNTIINCGQLGKNQFGSSYVVGNTFIQDDSFVSDSAENTICYYNGNDLVFENNYMYIGGNSGNVRYIMSVFPNNDATNQERIRIKNNRIIVNANSKYTVLNMYSTNFKVRNILFKDNYIKLANGQNSIIYMKNVENVSIEGNYFEAVVGALTTGSYYGLFFETYTKDLVFSRNKVIFSGNLNSLGLRAIYFLNAANGLTKLDNNITDMSGITNGTIYHMQFYGGSGYKVLSNHYVSGSGTLTLGTSVTQLNNYTTGAIVSTTAD